MMKIMILHSSHCLGIKEETIHMASINNPFQTDPTDTLYIFNQLAKPVAINGNEAQAILTHSALNTSFDDYKITSLSLLQCGDQITFNNKKYLVISEVNDSRRSGKYKAIMRFLPFSIHTQVGEDREIIGYDDMYNPIYSDSVPIYADIDCYIQNQPQVQLDSSGSISYIDGQFYIVTKDDENSQKINEGTTLDLIGNTWKVNYVDLSRQGLRIFKLDKTASPSA